MPKKYKAKYSGKVFNTKEEAAKDNARYLKDVRYRYLVKGDNLGHPLEYAIPFINDKRITLSNAGLATGAVLSENMLDSIAKYATLAGLPIKTAIGLAVKESTLGNPTDDTSVYLLLSPENEAQFRKWGTGQHINTEGLDMLPRNLLNFYVDERNTYEATQDYIDRKAKGNEDKALLMLIEGEKYADKLALNYADIYANNNVMYNAFKFYKEHPSSYNPKLSNYQLLVNRRANETWKSPEIQSWYLNYQNTHEDGGPLHPDWNELSMKDRAAYIRMGVANGYKNIEDIINVYNEFRKGGAKLNPRESYIHEELPTLLRDAGLNVRVTSGYRPVGAVGTAGARSWHPRHGAVDIVPQGDTTFEDIENVLHNHPVIRQYMLSHNLGLLDESGRTPESKETMRRTGATGAHFHIGRDSKPAAAYRLRVGALLPTDGSKVVYFTNPFLPLEQPIENNNAVVDSTPIVPLPVNEDAILSVNPYEEKIAYEKTLPEVVVRPEPKIINPLAVYEDMLALAPALTPIEPPIIPSITEKVTALSDARNTFLQNELENSIMRSQLIDDEFNREKLRRDIEDLKFYRNMSAYGGNLHGGGGGLSSLMPIINAPAAAKGLWRAAKRRIYRTVTPQDYNIGRATREFVGGNTRDMNASTPAGNEEWAKYLGVPYEGPTNFEPATYTPLMGGATYDTVLKFKDESQVLSDNVLRLLIENLLKTGKNTLLIDGNGTGLGSYTVSMGEDDKGKYISYYDDWDINPFKGINARLNIPIISSIENVVPETNPFTVYGRRYYTDEDILRVNNKKALGGSIANMFLTGGPKGRLKVTNLSTWDEVAALAPFYYTLGKLLDPTGITGYADTKEAISEYDANPTLGTGYNAVMETLGSLPLINKAGKAVKVVLGLVNSLGVLNDWNHAKEMQDAYNKELVIDYWDNTVKSRGEASKHNEQMKKKMSYTDVNHLPSFELAPEGAKIGLVLPNYSINHRVVSRYKK